MLVAERCIRVDLLGGIEQLEDDRVTDHMYWATHSWIGRPGAIRTSSGAGSIRDFTPGAILL